MGEIARGLDREDEVLRNRIPPPAERFLLGQSVEGIVDLRSAEVLGIVLEEGLVGRVLRVECTLLPVVVMPAGRADVGSYAHHRCFRRAESSTEGPPSQSIVPP